MDFEHGITIVIQLEYPLAFLPHFLGPSRLLRAEDHCRSLPLQPVALCRQLPKCCSP